VNKLERRFYLVDAQVLPEVFLKVVRAKELLASGEARSISAATRAVELSRSAFYKYKDCIFDSENGREVITVMATLRDETGALQSLLAGISAAGASIVTINQSTPENGAALVRGHHPHRYHADVPGGTDREAFAPAYGGECALRV